MELINYSTEPENKLYSWLPNDLRAEKVIFFPDACPGRSPLPTGTVVYTEQENWRKFAVSDCGCGMQLVKSSVKRSDFGKSLWDELYYNLKQNKGKLGDLGSGNHFLDALESYDDDFIYFLVHTGSRNESKIVDHLIEQPIKFNRKFAEVCHWAERNRSAIIELVENIFGKTELIVDKNHNHFETTDSGVIIRKGSVRVEPGELTVLPSNIEGDVVLVKATEKVLDTYKSLNHGTGRVMSRSEAKLHAADYDYDDLRSRIYIPEMIGNVSIKTEAPFCYRDLDSCLILIDDLISVEKRFNPFAYLGQI
jgi:RNA-splicing ligase RtcB